MGELLRQIRLLLWKSWLLRKRHFIVTGFEILLPLLLCILVAYIRVALADISDGQSDKPQSEVVPANQPKPWDPMELSPYQQAKPVYYTPYTNYTAEVVQQMLYYLGWEQIIPVSVESEQSLEAMAVNSSMSSMPSIIGIVFTNPKEDLEEPPLKLHYKLRFQEKIDGSLFPMFQNPGPNDYDGGYKSSGFMAVQRALDKAHMEMVATNTNDPLLTNKLQMQAFPFPEYVKNDQFLTIFSLVPMFIIMGLIVASSVIVKRVVDEKCNRAKEMMRLMGMDDWLYWLTTFLNNYLLLVVIFIFAIIIFIIPFKNGHALLDYSDGSVLFVLMLIYGVCFVVFSLAITPFFNKPILAIIADIVIYLVLTYNIPATFMDPIGSSSRTQIPLAGKLAVCLLPNMAFHFGCKIIAVFEGTGVGAKWSNLFEAPNPNDDLTIGLVIIMMLISILLYTFILWYFDAVWPWQNGVPKPWYFPFQASFWTGSQGSSINSSEMKKKSSEYFEEEPHNLTPGISIMNLTKVFGFGSSAKYAVNGMSLNIYNGQITALLGHNGAGKTTTMNMITGMFVPTSGTAKINGFDILTETKEARKSIGLCPQHNVIYDELTVGEHLKFFAGLKGCPWNTLDHHVNQTLKLLQLENKKDDLSKNLSGGMKRKLCLGIAYIGGSQILILDEPTSGMDPQARRAVWDLLQEIRGDRTILLTTHYMEEADVLGDRIAIMAEGDVKCSGSPLFLKRKFGAGYQLRVVKGDHCHVYKVTDLIQKHIPDATLESDISTEIIYSLSNESSGIFPALFRDLEESKNSLGIATCGISVTTMEDVFLKVGHMSEVEGKSLTINSDYGSTDALTANGDNGLMDRDLDSNLTATRLTGVNLWLVQLKGLLIKRAQYAKRHWSVLIFQLLLPSLIWSILLILDTKMRSGSSFSEKGLSLDLTLYGKTNSFFMIDSPSDPEVLDLGKKVYPALLKSKSAKIESTNNATEYILDVADKDRKAYSTKYMVGGSFSTGEIFAWYNRAGLPTGAISLNLMDTAILRKVCNKDDAELHVTNHPLPTTWSQDIINPIGPKMLYAFLVPFALTFLASSYVMFPIHERMSKAKLLQLMSGLNGAIFWGASFLWDFTIHFFMCMVLLIFIPIFDRNHIFTGGDSSTIGSVFVLFVFYGWCSIPLAYLLSLIFKKPSTGFSFFLLFSMITGMILASVMVPLESVFKNPKSYDALMYALRILPTFSVTWGVMNIQNIGGSVYSCNKVNKELLRQVCPSEKMAEYLQVKMCCKDLCGDNCAGEANPFAVSKTGCGGDLIMMFCMGIIFLGILCIAEMNLTKFWYRLSKAISNRKRQSVMAMTMANSTAEDSDVVQERQRIEDLFVRHKTSEEAMAVLNLSKSFKTVVAVNHLTFGVHKEECFGLLGVNGAGKTTTFRMLTGDLTMTDGNAYIENYDIRENLRMFQTFVGYCPQFDPLLDRLTGREMLYLFGRLRGVPEKNLSHIVGHLIKMVDLTKHADKVTEAYSGGNRRKLSLAMALIGSPPIVFLDEPTSGVDPAARRKIWSTLIEAQNRFHVSVILTSHSMEECEALCSRIAIMVNGEFRCLGGIQYLRSKFGQGYTLIVKMKREQIADTNVMLQIKNFIEASIPSVALRDIHQGMIHYHVMDTSVPWSKLFEILEDAKHRFELEDYVISDTTLEQIFLMFARAQRITSANAT